MTHESPPQPRSGLAPGVPDRRRNDPAARAEREAFARILARITRARGFRIGDNTLQRLRAVIWERVLVSGAGTAVAYLAQLDDAELAALHDAIAIRETRFFRVPAQFWLLRDDLLPLHALGNVPPDLRARYFDHVGEMFAISPLLRDLTTFQHADLLAPVWPVADGSADVIFCQNVLRFLPRDAVSRVVERLYATLAPGGYLFLAPGETLPRARAPFDRVQLPSALFFQKPL